MMNLNVAVSQAKLLKASFESIDEEIIYDPYPITETGQRLDLIQNKCQLLPERLLLNFEHIHPYLREHVKAWISYACKKYANESLYNHIQQMKVFKFDGEAGQEAVAESLEKQVRQIMESDIGSSRKSTIRLLFGWCVEEQLPFFDEDFFDLYLDTLKFGTDEGKGKDVLMEMANRGPLTISEQRIFKEALAKVDPKQLSLIELQGMVGLKIAQVLGARDVQVVKIQFKHLGVSDEGKPYLLLPRAKQRGYKNNNKHKKRPITHSLNDLISTLKRRYEEASGKKKNGEDFLLCNLTPRSGLPTKKRLNRPGYMRRRLDFERALGLNFKVTNRRLRKTFCTQLIAKGTPLKVVAELMDHSDLQQLEVYYRHTHHIARKLNDVLRAEASDLLDAFEGKVVAPEDASQVGQQIFAPSSDQKLHLIGSCGSATPCSLNPPLSCYGCSSLEAFEDADHKGVVDNLVQETNTLFGESHAVEILQHKDFLAATKFVQMLERGEI
ncbi:MAG: phage integrase family protein [Idiomarinaceae bacterium HL-53]|nr:MAG: phage integrase family protein [Idiomarinaceae bacterium HL-53]CUS47492.1 Phage integrase family protein [Idiomarinaceae bacterium HL-53]